MIPEAADAAIPEHLRGSDHATGVRALLARLERLNADGTRKASNPNQTVDGLSNNHSREKRV